MSVREIIVADCETTGLDRARHTTVEVAWWHLGTGQRGVFTIDQRPAEAQGPAPSEADYTAPDKAVWHVGDPEPLDVPALVDREGDTWINLEPDSWYEQRTGPAHACSWESALEYAPLRRPEQPAPAALLADSREG